MRRTLLASLAVVATACSDAPESARPDATVAPEIDAAAPDGAQATMGFGELSGMCGVLALADLTSPDPELVRATMTFAREYVDPDDRPLLTPGGLHLAETPNAGGSSGLSEIFAYEQLARCEQAGFLKTETEIVYDTAGKITDLEVTLDGEKIGVSVTRAQTYPLGTPYTLSAATTLIKRKLDDIKLSTTNVSAADRWRKQILAILAWDTQAADTAAQAWADVPAASRADTIVIITTTEGADTFIYTNH